MHKTTLVLVVKLRPLDRTEREIEVNRERELKVGKYYNVVTRTIRDSWQNITCNVQYNVFAE